MRSAAAGSSTASVVVLMVVLRVKIRARLRVRMLVYNMHRQEGARVAMQGCGGDKWQHYV